jgi:competence protein ComEC
MKAQRRYWILLPIAFLLALGITASLFTGPWTAPLRAVGLLPSPDLEINYIDVGNMSPNIEGLVGDSILIRSSEGKTMLIDGGYENGKALAFLQANNVTHIDVVVLSHLHEDHTGGLIDVLKNIPVDLFVHSGQTDEADPTYLAFVQALEESGVPQRIVKKNDTIPFGSLSFHVLSPRKIIANTANDNSVVLRLVNGRVSFLFTGDAQALAEEIMLAGKLNVQADILKVAHHGADTSTTSAFLEAVDPEVAIYIAGAGNMHNLPHDVTLQKLKEHGASIYGTDASGTITLRTDGKTYQITTERGDAEE